MKASSVHDIKKELLELSHGKVVEMCLRLARFKKENKELLTYLLFESHDEQSYLGSIQNEIDEQFLAMNKSNLYFAKKSVRKILRLIAKHSRYIGSDRAQADLLLYFCFALKNSGLQISKNVALKNIYERQLEKITKAIVSLHEDLQYDYFQQLKKLENLKTN